MPGGNPFEDMSHERMLQWLDQANSATVQAAADRLAKAAEEIHKIAEELRIRPQWVEWKGEGANAFRTWTADLANSTLRLGDFSESSAKWLAQASSAIARAQAAIPRDTKTAESNRAAAASTPNDPDADAVTTKSTAELAALAENKEKVRREAAAEMIKLGQAYEFSAVQLNALERPKFPPPPVAIAPPESGSRIGSTAVDRSGASANSGSASDGFAPLDIGNRSLTSDFTDVRRVPNHAQDGMVPTKDAPPIRMGIDSVETPLPDKQTTSPPASSQPTGRSEVPTAALPTGVLPSTPRGASGAPTSSGLPQARTTATGRVPPSPGPIVPPSSPPRAPSSTGIIGGRPVSPTVGGATGAVHRGTVVGGPGANGRMPASPLPGMTTPGGRTTGQQRYVSGGRVPTSNGGVIGENPQRTGRAVPAAASSAIASGSAGGRLARDGVVGGAVPGAARTGNAGTGTPRVARPTSAGSPEDNKKRTRSASDQKTGRQDNGRPVSPVID